MIERTIFPITKEDFVNVVKENGGIEFKHLRYAWLRAAYLREALCCEERGTIAGHQPQDSWSYWVCYGLQAAFDEDYQRSRKAAFELEALL